MQAHRSYDFSIRIHAWRVLQATLASLALAGTAAGQATEPAQTKAQAEAAFTRADTDRDGRLSRAEAASLPEVAQRFDALDKDRDGLLSMAEYMAAFAAKK